ncbi:MAG TPA: Fe-S metabolism protein SufE [Microscillaceae bacterium]|jgi:cysteine desulfuration protein SufE|nr:Fe-S metabolism protein SufE [Microscillaceae bacterium]
MSITAIQDEIVENFNLFDNWDDKYAYLIELGKKLPPLDEKHKTEDKIIKGCQSKVWLHSYLNDEQKVIFEGDSDAMIVKGLVSLLIQALSNQPAAEILNTDLYFLDQIGMKQHLSMNRANGLAAMIKQMKMYALALQQIHS